MCETGSVWRVVRSKVEARMARLRRRLSTATAEFVLRCQLRQRLRYEIHRRCSQFCPFLSTPLCYPATHILFPVSLPTYSCLPCLEHLRPRTLILPRLWYYIKGELNIDKKWWWFVLYNNEWNSPLFQPILSNFKDIVIYLKNLLIHEYRQNSLIPLSMVAGVSDTTATCQQQWSIFFTQLRLNTSVDHVERGRTSHSSCWMCYCTLINQFITLKQRKSLQNLQTTNHR